MAIKSKNTCLQKATEDEELFVLRAQDVSSPKVILYWMIENWDGSVPDDKMREAFECALCMKHHKNRKSPD